MEANQWLISRLKDDFEHSPVSNVFFSFLLALVERVVEVEFACPCYPQWNVVFAAAFFVIPAIIVFLLMVIIYKCKSPSHYPKCLSSFIPPFIWVVLLFFNGQYFVCATTYWPGTFVSVDKTYMKWCTPTNIRITHDLFVLRWENYLLFYIFRQDIRNVFVE